jgi:predicted dehydrogenase
MRLELLQSAATGGRVRRRVHRFPGVMLGEHLRSYRWVVTRSFIAEFDAFAALVRGDASLAASGTDGLRALEIARGIAPQDSRSGSAWRERPQPAGASGP